MTGCPSSHLVLQTFHLLLSSSSRHAQQPRETTVLRAQWKVERHAVAVQPPGRSGGEQAGSLQASEKGPAMVYFHVENVPEEVSPMRVGGRQNREASQQVIHCRALPSAGSTGPQQFQLSHSASQRHRDMGLSLALRRYGRRGKTESTRRVFGYEVATRI